MNSATFRPVVGAIESAGSTIKVLIVEDDPAIRRLIRLHLVRKFSCTVIEAEDGLIASEILQKEKPNLIFLDLNLPRKNGFELLFEIRKMEDEKLKGLPIIFCSARNDRDTLKQLLTDLRDFNSEYITKPFEPEILIQKTLKALKRSKAVKKEIFIDNQSKGNLSIPGQNKISYFRIVDFSGVADNDLCSINIQGEHTIENINLSTMPILKVPASSDLVTISISFAKTKNSLVKFFCTDV